MFYEITGTAMICNNTISMSLSTSKVTAAVAIIN